MSKSRYLIIGSDGTIGNALLHAMPTTQVIGTTRRLPVANNQIFLDLSRDLKDWSIPDEVQVVINCAAMARLEVCRCDPIRSRQINVDSVVALADKCREAGIFFIHLSSDKVFSGQLPRMPVDAPFAPLTEYGRQKADAERYLLTLLSAGAPLAIVRLTKVLMPNMQLFRQWRDALQQCEVICPFADMTLAPIPLPFVVEAINKIANEQCSGIFQLSADLDISYAEVAQRLAAQIGINNDLIQPVSATQTQLFEESISPYTSLDCASTQERLQIELPSIWKIIDWAIQNPKTKAEE